MIDCEPSSLSNVARCLDGCGRGIQEAIKGYLLCQWSNLSPVGSGNHILAESGDILNTESGLQLITES